MTLTTANMGLLQAQGSDNAGAYLKTYLAASLTAIDAHDHSATRGVPVKRLASGVFASRPAVGNPGHVYVAIDSNRVSWDNGSSWIEAIINGTSQAVALGGGLTLSAGGLTLAAGNLGIGAAPVAFAGAQITAASLTGASQYGVQSAPIGSSGATAEVAGYLATPQTAAAAFTAAAVAGFHAQSPSKGAGSTITSAYGLLVDQITAGNTSNYGAYINAASGAATNNESLHVESALGPTFRVYGVGDVQVGTGNALATNAAAGFLAISGMGGAPSGAPTQTGGRFPMVFDSTNNKLWILNGTWKGVVLS